MFRSFILLGLKVVVHGYHLYENLIQRYLGLYIFGTIGTCLVSDLITESHNIERDICCYITDCLYSGLVNSTSFT